jgi:hypothetical protein
MSVLQNEPKGARWASFGFALTVFGLLPSEIGYQDIAALLARQPGVTQRWQKHALASPFGTIHAATFSLPSPLGASIPRAPGVRLAGLRGDAPDVTGSIARNPLGEVIRPPQPHEFPTVDRTAKGDRLSSKGNRLQTRRPDEDTAAQPVLPEDEAGAAMPASAPAAVEPAAIDPAQNFNKSETASAAGALDPELEAALKSAPLPQYHASQPAAANAVEAERDALPPKDQFSLQSSHLYFGNSLSGSLGGSLERWQPGEEPRLVLPDTDLKQTAALPGVASEGSTVAPKGEVTGLPQRAKSPAERLGLDAKGYAKASKCLSEAVYFEARSEPVRGQIAGVLGLLPGDGVRRRLSEFAPLSRLPVHLRLRRRARRGDRARAVGSRQEDRQGDARRPVVAA